MVDSSIPQEAVAIPTHMQTEVENKENEEVVAPTSKHYIISPKNIVIIKLQFLHFS